MIDVTSNRADHKWTRREQLGRALWALAMFFFRLSPRPLWAWRRALLRAFGAQVGADVHIYSSVRIAIPWNLTLGEQCAVGDRAILYSLGRITLGPRAVVSQGGHVCAGTHDISRPDRPLLKLPVTIESDAWVAADAFIGPGVVVGHGAIVGARAVVVKDVAPENTVAGNPARVISKDRPK